MYWLTGLLGILLIISPFVLNFRGDMPALWSTVILGLAVLVVSAYKAVTHDHARWEYWAAAIIGILAIIAPFVLGFSMLANALWASVILGVIVLILSAYELWRMQSMAQRPG
ncbi:MAG: SPW repeat protein [Rudaea sp.]